MTAVTEILNVAKSYVHDDHAQTQGWASSQTWLSWANREWYKTYPMFVRKSLVDADVSITTFIPPQVTVADAAAIIMVYESLTGEPGEPTEAKRILRPSQDTLGVYYLGLDSVVADGISWAAGSRPYTAGMTVLINPTPDNQNYNIVYAKKPLALVESGAVGGVSTSVLELPDVVIDRIALGIAKRALVRAHGRSQALQELINEAEVEMTFAGATRITAHSPRMKNMDWLYRGRSTSNQDSILMSPGAWWWR